jgi:hypothetical protein
MDIYCTNPGGTRFKVLPKDFTITFPKQRDKLEPRTMSLETGRTVPIQQFAVIIAVDRGSPRFRGYVKTYQIDSNKNRSFEIAGIESLLNQRYALNYFYPKGTINFTDLFSDTLTDLAQPGLLAMANSALPRGLPYTVYNATENIIKITGGGKSSRLSTYPIYGQDYRYVRKMDEATILGDLVYLDNAFYRDDTDLYVKLKNHYHRGWYDVGGLYVENAFNTTCKPGTFDQPTAMLTGSLQTDNDPIGDLMVDLANASGFYVHFHDDWTNTYIDILDTEGR